MEEIAKMNYLASETLRFTKTEGGFLSLSVGEKTYARIMIQRAFPLSQPAGYLSVREVKENREPG